MNHTVSDAVELRGCYYSVLVTAVSKCVGVIELGLMAAVSKCVGVMEWGLWLLSVSVLVSWNGAYGCCQ